MKFYLSCFLFEIFLLFSDAGRPCLLSTHTIRTRRLRWLFGTLFSCCLFIFIFILYIPYILLSQCSDCICLVQLNLFSLFSSNFDIVRQGLVKILKRPRSFYRPRIHRNRLTKLCSFWMFTSDVAQDFALYLCSKFSSW